MDIQQFYDANEARRQSAEFEFGTDWTDENGHSFELSWIEKTGELYLMFDPSALVVGEMIFGTPFFYDEPMSELTVKVIATFATHDEVRNKLNGWETAIEQSNSLAWLAQQIPPIVS